MFRHIYSALFFILLSFLMVRPSASTNEELAQNSLVPKVLDDLVLEAPQCRHHIAPFTLDFEVMKKNGETLYCGPEKNLWNSEDNLAVQSIKNDQATSSL